MNRIEGDSGRLGGGPGGAPGREEAGQRHDKPPNEDDQERFSSLMEQAGSNASLPGKDDQKRFFSPLGQADSDASMPGKPVSDGKTSPGGGRETSRWHDKPPNREDQERFSSLLEKADSDAPPSGKPGSDEKAMPGREPGEAKPPTLPGDSILHSLGATGRGAPDAVAESHADLSLTRICQDLVERILVSSPSAGSGEEVRILLRNDILPETEIRIRRDGAGLHVEFVTQSADANRFLLAHAGDLQQYLSQRLADVVVRVDVQHETPDGEANDGRSRQRRNLYEEQQDSP
jgi:type III secretion system needle length determinant